MPGVTVENRWVPEDELGALLAWSDALVLSHREASQSGVAAAAIAAGRWVVSTRVGGLVEQLAGEPLARLCDVSPEALAEAIGALVADPPPVQPRADPREAWRVMAADLMAQIVRLDRSGGRRCDGRARFRGARAPRPRSAASRAGSADGNGSRAAGAAGSGISPLIAVKLRLRASMRGTSASSACV